MVTKIEVEITDIKTDEQYCSFKYKIKVNGKIKNKGSYDDDHSWGHEHEKFAKVLKDGYAVKLALESLDL